MQALKSTAYFFGWIIFVIGLAGIPEDMATWRSWITPVAAVINQEIARWIFAIGGLLTIAVFHIWPRFRSRDSTNSSQLHNSLKSPSDHWRHVDEYKLWQVACLWVGMEPEAKIPDGHPAYPILQMLTTDVTNYKLLATEDVAGQRIHIHEEGDRKPNVDIGTLVSRGTILGYISNYKDKPKWDFGAGEISQSAEPQYDTPIYEAVNYIAKKIEDRDGDQFYPRARQALRQAAFDMRITMYGEKELKDGYSSKLWTPIPDDYWSDQELNVLTTDEHYVDHDHTQPEQREGFNKLGSDREKYFGIRVSMEEVKKKWP